jgi:predicted aspartyl protease
LASGVFALYHDIPVKTALIAIALLAFSTAAIAQSPDVELKNFRLDALQKTLQAMGHGAEREYFEGMLANRTGRIADSIRLLNDALPHIRQSQPVRAALALRTLGDNYDKTFRYADAYRAYDDLLAHFAGQLDMEDLQGVRDDAQSDRILRDAPAQTIAWNGPVHLQTHRNTMGSMVTDLTVNGVRGPWLLDTGANTSVVSRSFARQLGIKPLHGYANAMAGVTGIENRSQLAVLPVLQVGGATLHNVVLLILDDANLNMRLPTGPNGAQYTTYQINAIIGYPVFQALSAITFLHDGGFEAGSATQRGVGGTPLYMRLLMPVIDCEVNGQHLPFSFDTGASGTTLSVRYYEQFRNKALKWKKGENVSVGGGGMVRQKVYLQPTVKLSVGDKVATIRNVTIIPRKMGSDQLDELYGNLGQDVVSGFESFTLDFSNMTLSLGAPLSERGAR